MNHHDFHNGSSTKYGMFLYEIFVYANRVGAASV